MTSPVPRTEHPSAPGGEGLPWEWVERRLLGARNYWLCTASVEHGPHARPVWAVWCGGGLLFTAGAESRKMRDLTVDSRVSVHPELQREVVVVAGRVEPEAAPDPAWVDAYEAKYDWLPRAQGWYLVAPLSIYASPESSYPRQATTFRF